MLSIIGHGLPSYANRALNTTTNGFVPEATATPELSEVLWIAFSRSPSRCFVNKPFTTRLGGQQQSNSILLDTGVGSPFPPLR